MSFLDQAATIASENFNSTHQTFYIFTSSAEQVIHRRHRLMNTYATQKLCIYFSWLKFPLVLHCIELNNAQAIIGGTLRKF